MQEIADVLNTVDGPKSERVAAQRAFVAMRVEIWNDIQEGNFPETYISARGKKFVGAPRRTAIRCDFLMASKIALGRNYVRDRIADLAQRDLLLLPKVHGEVV